MEPSARRSAESLRVAMVVFARYPFDGRVRREAEALAKSGMDVDVIGLRGPDEPAEEVVDSVRVFRLPVQHARSGGLRYLWEYSSFLLRCSLRLSLLHLRRHYQIIQVHNMPDILVFSALLPRLTGARLLLDLHDPMPEVYMSKYQVAENHWVIRLLRLMEGLSVRMADAVITPNSAFRDLFVSRGCSPSKIRVVMNSADERFFKIPQPSPASISDVQRNGSFVLMYHGTLTRRYGIDKALQAIAAVRGQIPRLSFQVYGEGEYVPHFLKAVEALRLQDVVRYHGNVALETIAQVIPQIDVGLIPNEPSRLWDLAVPTRVFEYLAMGKPAIAPRTQGILDYFDDESLCFFESGNAASLAQAIWSLYRDPERRRRLAEKGTAVCKQYDWLRQSPAFVALVRSLAGEGGPEGR